MRGVTRKENKHKSTRRALSREEKSRDPVKIPDLPFFHPVRAIADLIDRLADTAIRVLNAIMNSKEKILNLRQKESQNRIDLFMKETDFMCRKLKEMNSEPSLHPLRPILTHAYYEDHLGSRKRQKSGRKESLHDLFSLYGPLFPPSQIEEEKRKRRHVSKADNSA